MENRLKEFFNSLNIELGINPNNSYHRGIYNLLFYVKTQLRKGEGFGDRDREGVVGPTF